MDAGRPLGFDSVRPLHRKAASATWRRRRCLRRIRGRDQSRRARDYLVAGAAACAGQSGRRRHGADRGARHRRSRGGPGGPVAAQGSARVSRDRARSPIRSRRQHHRRPGFRQGGAHRRQEHAPARRQRRADHRVERGARSGAHSQFRAHGRTPRRDGIRRRVRNAVSASGA